MAHTRGIFLDLLLIWNISVLGEEWEQVCVHALEEYCLFASPHTRSSSQALSRDFGGHFGSLYRPCRFRVHDTSDL